MGSNINFPSITTKYIQSISLSTFQLLISFENKFFLIQFLEIEQFSFYKLPAIEYHRAFHQLVCLIPLLQIPVIKNLNL